MLAAHQDQENQVFSQPAGAAAKQSFQSKAPGARYPKTPLKVPLSDDNAARVFAGKSIIKTANNNENLTTIGRGAKGKNNIVTPLEPRTARAPLGNKTTNAKARAGQPAGVKDIVQPMEKSQTKATPAPRSRNGPSKVERLRLEVHGDKDPLEEEEDVEYAPPPVKAKPYESDLVPAHLLTFKGLKRENMLKGYYEHYYQDFDENGMSVKERELEEQRRRALQKGEEQICQDTENMNWSVSDVPESNDYFKKRQGDKHAAEGMFETSSALDAFAIDGVSTSKDEQA
ncbi:hypothetical protein P8C59_006139 [Phyllachora maydis]|uniref:Uncharacterized protein n=1 Tax=Phyllachora maydis TaxID=1825666 RepID=A0AAD9I5U7_9PEZI|nr:hypothetical protein P8C59_006139 [Phyllachora maydis]